MTKRLRDVVDGRVEACVWADLLVLAHQDPNWYQPAFLQSLPLERLLRPPELTVADPELQNLPRNDAVACLIIDV